MIRSVWTGILIWPLLLAAQSPFTIETDRTGLVFSGGYQYWQAVDDKVSQFSIPVTFALPLGDQLYVKVSTSPAFSQAQVGSSNSLSGLSDTRISGSYTFPNERFLLTFGANLPSGKNNLNTEELSVANLLSLHALNFSVPILGQGFDAGGGIVMAQPVGLAVVGIGAGYLYRGAYNPFESVDMTYNPGDEWSASVGLDVPLSRRISWYLDLVYTTYSEDRSDGLSVFRAGNRFSAKSMLYFPGEIWSYALLTTNRFQSKNSLGSGNLVPERLNTNNAEHEITSFLFLKWNRGTTYHFMLQGRFYEDNAAGFGATNLGTLALGLQTLPFSSVQLDLAAGGSWGNYNTGSKRIPLVGFHLNGGLVFYL